METILEMLEDTVILAIRTRSLQIFEQWREETLEAKVLALMVVEANILSHENQGGYGSFSSSSWKVLILAGNEQPSMRKAREWQRN